MKNKVKISAIIPLVSPVAAARLSGHESEFMERVTTTKAAMKIQPGVLPDNVVPYYASTRDLDRDGDVVLPDGIDTSEYLPNGPILECHDYRTIPHAKAIHAKQVARARLLNLT